SWHSARSRPRARRSRTTRTPQSARPRPIARLRSGSISVGCCARSWIYSVPVAAATWSRLPSSGSAEHEPPRRIARLRGAGLPALRAHRLPALPQLRAQGRAPGAQAPPSAAGAAGAVRSRARRLRGAAPAAAGHRQRGEDRMTRYGLARRIDLVAAWVRLRGPLETDPTWFADVASTLEAIAAEVRERAP